MASLSPFASPLLVPEQVLEELLSPAFRIPLHVRPQHYALEFQPDAQRHTFAGAVYITLCIVETPAFALRYLILHALHLHMEASSIRVFVPSVPSRAFEAAARSVHPSHHLGDEVARQRPFSTESGSYLECQGLDQIGVSETVLLAFDAPLPRKVGDTFVLIIDRFDGAIATPPEMEGLFHSNSTDVTVLSTHLEPTGARRLYPCFDEPAIQSTFQLSVIASATQTVLSNTEMEAVMTLSEVPYGAQARQGAKEDAHGPCREAPASLMRASRLPWSMPPAPSWHCVRFHITPLLHTCIVGFHVGRFAFLEQCSRISRVLCRVALPHTEADSSGCFALDLATKAVDFFEDFFSVPLPLRKLDIVGVEAFGVLGMENWGMINILLDHLVVTETTPLERRQRVTRLIGHEIGHQWFGGRISIAWWDCLWLKEGMCRFLEYVFVDAVFPGWGLWNDFLCNIMNDALLADADPRRTHPVDCCNPAPRRIYDSFDAISYGKGACVLRMLFSIIGVEWLKRATHLLMVRFAGRAINARDFANCIADTAEEQCSGETQLRHVKVIRSCLRMVETVSHPYLYIDHRSGESYTITQYMPPNRQLGLLAEYLQQQRSKASAPVIDFLSAPVRDSFEWMPERTFSRVTTSFSIPLRAVQCTPSGCHNAHLIFLEEAAHHFPCPASASTPRATDDDLITSLGLAGAGTGAVSRAAASFPTRQTPASSPPSGAASGTWYFNRGGSGFFQCDYDAATWRRLFEFAAFFPEEDRMIITMHFINYAKVQLGRQPGDTGDRCTLFFEWLLHLTGSPGSMNSFLWGLVTHALTTLVQLVQEFHCHSTVKAFVNSLYVPLQRRCALSFFAQEKTVTFQCSIHLSRQLMLRILQLLCLCDNPAVTEEAETVAQWSMRALLSLGDSHHHTSSDLFSTTGGVNASLSTGIRHPSDLGVNAGPTLSADIPSPRSSGELLSSTSTPVTVSLKSGTTNFYACDSVTSASSLVRELNEPNASISRKAVAAHGFFGSLRWSAPPTERDSGCSKLFATSYGDPAGGVKEGSRAQSPNVQSYPSRGAGKFNVDDLTHIQAGAIALSHLVAQGRLVYWVAAAAVAVELLRLNRHELQCVSGLPVPVPRVADLGPAQRRSVLRLILPAVFALDQRSAFPFMAKVFHAVRFIESSAAMRLFRNSRFFAHLLSSWRLTDDRRTFEFLLRYGAEACGNGYIIAQLKMLAQRGSTVHSAARTTSVEQYVGVELADSPPLRGSSSSEEFSKLSSPSLSSSSTPVSERIALRAQYPATAAALDCMESNYVWMYYCCSHYHQFLHEQLRCKTGEPVRHQSSSSMPSYTPVMNEGGAQS